MLPLHPNLRKNLLINKKYLKKDVYEITESAIKNFEDATKKRTRKKGSKKDSQYKDIMESFKNICILGKRDFKKRLKKEIQNKNYKRIRKSKIVAAAEKRELTSNDLIIYDKLMMQLYFHEYYEDAPKKYTEDYLYQLLQANELKHLMPILEPVNENWTKQQKKISKISYFDSNVHTLLNWFKKNLLSKKSK